MRKSRINWSEVQKFYDSGKTIAECCEYFGFCPDTACKARKAGKLVIRDKSACQKPAIICSDRIASLVADYLNGSSYRDLIKAGYKLSEYNYARDNRLLTVRSSAEQTAIRIEKYGPNRPGEEARKALSIRQSLHNSGGRCKWYEVAGQKVQGSWERDIASKFEEIGVKWIKPKIHSDILHYELNGEVRSYTPDFYLPDYDLYIEVKGYWWGNDKSKMNAVMKQHSDKKILIVEKDGYEAIMQGKQLW